MASSSPHENGLSLAELLKVSRGQGITYDDVIILPRYVEAAPSEVDLHVDLAPGLSALPIISSPMDTVTEWRMAVQMALNGCIGFLHTNLSLEDTCEQIRRVKRFQMGFIRSPVCLTASSTVRDIHAACDMHGFSTFPVTFGPDGKGEFLGLITKTCFDLEENLDRPVAELMIKTNQLLTPSGREVPTLDAAKVLFRKNPGIAKLPILDSNGCLEAMVSRKNVAAGSKYPNVLEDGNNQLRVGAAVSTHPEDRDRVRAFIDAGVDAILIDSSQGSTGYAVDLIRHIRSINGKIPVVAGNVVTPDQAEVLHKAGADIIRVGMGSGSICITQGQYGLGRAQATAVAYNKGCIADGGIRNSGDMLKALALGAKAVMVGGFIAGCDETPSDLVEANGRRYRQYRGMGSAASMQRRGALRYQSGGSSKRVVVQGVEGLVPAIGPLDARLAEALDGLRGALSQLGCSSIQALQDEVRAGEIRFELRSTSATVEGGVHDLVRIS